MDQVVIENPILNSPFLEPTRHFKFSDEGITNETVETRRISSYFIPVAQPKKKGKQLSFDTEWTQDRIEENKFINLVRAKVAQWRSGRYPDITKTTRRLLEYWNHPERERKLFFCQIEALETSIFITEIATSYAERQNLQMRMSMRRFTGLTNAHSKKVQNHIHAISAYFMCYICPDLSDAKGHASNDGRCFGSCMDIRRNCGIDLN